jgi:hypothetical protein
VKKSLLVFFLGLFILVSIGVCSAWWVGGHERIAEGAAEVLPDDMPTFFRDAGKLLGHYSGDPDRWKNPAMKFLKAEEAPNHYIDLEHLGTEKLPDDRYQAVLLFQKLGHKTDRVGLLPYALVENYERLCCAFYDHRADRENAAIRAKCLVHAGVMAHYTGDCSMPLHTTKDFDGRLGKDGKLKQKGIHARIDAFPERHGIAAREIIAGIKAKKIDNVWEHIRETIQESHKHIDRCYELDEMGAFETPTKESRQFIVERCRLGAQLTADLWYSAWLRSATMPKPY